MIIACLVTFQIIDLISQAIAIEEHLAGKSDREIINWLQERGRIQKLAKQTLQEKQLFRFYSYLGIEATFFLDRGKFFFIGDHYIFRSQRIR